MQHPFLEALSSPVPAWSECSESDKEGTQELSWRAEGEGRTLIRQCHEATFSFYSEAELRNIHESSLWAGRALCHCQELQVLPQKSGQRTAFLPPLSVLRLEFQTVKYCINDTVPFRSRRWRSNGV